MYIQTTRKATSNVHLNYEEGEQLTDIFKVWWLISFILSINFQNQYCKYASFHPIFTSVDYSFAPMFPFNMGCDINISGMKHVNINTNFAS